MQYSAWTRLKAGSQHQVFPLLSKMLTLPLFFRKLFLWWGVWRIKTVYGLESGYRSYSCHLCHHSLSFSWLIDSLLLYSVALMPQRKKRIKKFTAVSAEKAIKLWLLLSKEIACKEIFSCFNVFSVFLLWLFFSIDTGTLGRVPKIGATYLHKVKNLGGCFFLAFIFKSIKTK